MGKQIKKYDLPTPAVIVDLDVVERNICDMVKLAEAFGLKHRPHIKTHRSAYFAEKQIAAGCQGITVAKLGEAEVMADNGISDIFVAYPLIGFEKINRLRLLSKRTNVSTIINSIEGALGLSQVFEQEGKQIDVLIELDGGLNRGGLKGSKEALEFARSVRDYPGIRISGLMYYGGLIYDSHNRSEAEAFTRQERDDLLAAAKLLEEDGFSMEALSAGSSFSGKCPEFLEGITEIRSGHYIFNDRGQLDVGLATEADCALRVISTVVAKPDNHVVICDVGTKSLTSDRCHFAEGFGSIVGYPKLKVYSLNEEHAFISCETDNPLVIGEKIELIPNHACVVTNLADKVYGMRDEKLERMIVIDAKGKSV